jgi:hypothetical protein
LTRAERRSGKDVGTGAKVGVVGGGKLDLAVVVTKLLELVKTGVTEVGGDEEETGFENRKGRGDGNGVKVFDLERLNLLLLMVDGNLEEVTLLALQQEEERTLSKNRMSNEEGKEERRRDGPSSCA